MNTPTTKYKNKSLELASGYDKMSYLFLHHVKNLPASRVCKIIYYLYRCGLNGLAQLVHNHFLRPIVRTDEWSLVVVYGRKYGMLTA